MHATGSFTVTLTPQPGDDPGAVPALARMTLTKEFHGDFQGTSCGTMLSVMTAVKGSAGYVALETLTGMLHGRIGSFVLQHSGTLTRGEPSLVVTVVPDSGTGQLEGLAGRLAIVIAAGTHSYEFDYTLPGPDPALGA